MTTTRVRPTPVPALPPLTPPYKGGERKGDNCQRMTEHLQSPRNCCTNPSPRRFHSRLNRKSRVPRGASNPDARPSRKCSSANRLPLNLQTTNRISIQPRQVSVFFVLPTGSCYNFFHSCRLPSWKIAVEELMRQECLGAVFATTTLATGVDFPARTSHQWENPISAPVYSYAWMIPLIASAQRRLEEGRGGLGNLTRPRD